MALHLVGVTLDKTRSHYMAETGKLVQLMRGIYVDAADDIDASILKHAVRIAKYLYPQLLVSGKCGFARAHSRWAAVSERPAQAAHPHPGAGDHPERSAQTSVRRRRRRR